MSWLSFLNPIASLGGTYLEGKNQVAKAKSAAAIVGLQAEADVKTAGARAAEKKRDRRAQRRAYRQTPGAVAAEKRRKKRDRSDQMRAYRQTAGAIAAEKKRDRRAQKQAYRQTAGAVAGAKKRGRRVQIPCAIAAFAKAIETTSA